MSAEHHVVYATGIGRIRYCRACHEPEESCRCRKDSALKRAGMPRDGIVRIALDRKGRAGKAGTLIVGLPEDEALLADLSSDSVALEAPVSREKSSFRATTAT